MTRLDALASPTRDNGMTCSLQWHTTHEGSWADLRKAVMGLPPRMLQAMAGGAVLCLLAWGGAQALQAISTPAVRAITAHPVTTMPTEHTRARCEGCGVIEAIRVIQGADGQDPTYEFSVRLRDGSLRTSITTGTASWQVGDRVIVMGRAATP